MSDKFYIWFFFIAGCAYFSMALAFLIKLIKR